MELQMIKSVRKLPKSNEGTNIVYDIVNPHCSNFIANGMLVHNTDSMFIHLDPVVKSILGSEYDSTSEENKVDMTEKTVKQISKYINGYVVKEYLKNHNTPSEDSIAKDLDFSFKEELIIKSGLFIDSKKKYAIWVKKKEGKPIDKIEVVGIEVVRSDYPQFSRTLLSELIHMILKDKASKAKISSFVVKKISEYKKILKAGSIDGGVPSIWNAGKDYKTLTPAVKGMLLYNSLTNTPSFSPGDKGYRFTINRVKTDQAGWDRIAKIFKNNKSDMKDLNYIVIPENKTFPFDLADIDYDAMISFAIYQRMEKILEVAGVSATNTDQVSW